jgi:crotonobetainyl-CoA:carnitine CoA-transferase CaiB-like acyl-CoA transferase
MAYELLKGIRIIELAEVWAGPTACSFMGDLGADVIKIESFPRNSPTRPLFASDWRVSPAGDGPPYERAWAHLQANRNKRNIALDLKTNEGIDIFNRLVKTADIVIESFSAGTIDRLGIGWDSMHKINDQVSLISIPGWGVEGIYKGYVSFGTGFDCVTGHAIMRGHPGRKEEEILGSTHSDATVAQALIFAVVSAMQSRDVKNKGIYIDFSQVQQLTTQLVSLYSEWALNKRELNRMGNENKFIVPHNSFPVAGEYNWVIIIAQDDNQWHGLCEAFNKEEWSKLGHKWSTIPGRLSDRDAINEAIGNITKTMDSNELCVLLQSKGVIASSVSEPAELLASDQLGYREWFQSLDNKFLGTRIYPGLSWSINNIEASPNKPYGTLGEDNHGILEQLGFSKEAIKTLEEKAVIGNKYEVKG